MNVSSLNIGKTFQLHLELFGNVVGGFERFRWVHDDVYFDYHAWAAMVGADGVDGLDQGGMGHC